MTPSDGLFSGPEANLSGPEWALLARLLQERLDKRRRDMESLDLSDRDRLITLGRLAELKDILALPEIERRRAKIVEGAFTSYE